MEKKTIRHGTNLHSGARAKGHTDTEDEQWCLTPTSPPSRTREWLVQNGFQQFASTFSQYSGLDMFRLSKADFKEICGIPAGLVMFEALRRPQSCVLRLYIKPENTNCYTAMFLQRFSYDDFVLKLSDILKCNPASIKQITMEHSTGIHILVTNEVIANMEDESIFTIKIERETSSSTNEQFDAAHSDHHISEEDSEEDSEDLHRANERQQPTKLIVKLKSQVEDCPENRSCI